jgi:hypothetical protein
VTHAPAHPRKLAWQARYWRVNGRVDIAERIEEELADAGRCRRCGRLLTDPASIAVGLGPDCRAKIALSGVADEAGGS